MINETQPSLKIRSDKGYNIDFVDAGLSSYTTGDHLLSLFRRPPHKDDLKQLHVALSRAVEEGDQLKIGIVLGQTISKLEQLIND